MEGQVLMDKFVLSDLDGNKDKLILKEIVQISFPLLQKINLNDNQIETVEGICKANMPSI